MITCLTCASVLGGLEESHELYFYSSSLQQQTWAAHVLGPSSGWESHPGKVGDGEEEQPGWMGWADESEDEEGGAGEGEGALHPASDEFFFTVAQHLMDDAPL